MNIHFLHWMLNVEITEFVRVMEHLKSHGILKFHFPGLEFIEIEVWVMESHGKPIYRYFLRINRQKDQKLKKKHP